ncbi:ComEA family DNA-binding protein [Parapedobacter sp. 10938]|uniref:ComEA family DNA-binding protein n=1 Tax=Parapedobacter flavus TaxID=3110225 RepID=UPI002DBDC9F2|nr:helix-hairpin-helix domain-containing protein [Parapedobacter sp. 10938]MEC3881365.1 helix-hairpin-helix domain-containing protein [Parapedobacter sp. 10938]
MRFSLCLVLVVLLSSDYAYGQNNVDRLIEQLTELAMEDLDENFDLSDLADRLYYYQRHPIDLNRTDGSELRELQFVPQLFIDNLLEHRSRSGAFVAIEELQAIDGLNIELLRSLLPYVTVRETSALSGVGVSELLKAGTHDLMVRYGRTVQQRKGYAITDTSRSRYLGSPDQVFVRYRYRYGNDLRVALNMKKDAGESFFSGAQQRGFDFYSGSVHLRNQGRLRDVVVGDYALQFGQGLAMWNGLGFGKGAMVQGIAKQATGLRPYTSSNEVLFLRGGAATVSLGKLAVTPFFSRRGFDGSLSQADDGRTTVGTLGQTGLHRTRTEVANRDAVQQWVSGANVLYQHRRFRAGLLTYYTRFDLPIEPQPLLRNRYAFSGDALWNSSFYYSHSWRGVYLFGEAAHNYGGGFAVMQGLIATLHHHLSLALHYRNYQRNYHSFFSQGLAAGSGVSNERGFYTGLVYHPSRKVEWTVYADFFRFPWLRYRVDVPSRGVDLLTQFTYTWYKKAHVSVRYRYRQRQENAAMEQPHRFVADVQRQQVRLSGQYKLSSRWTMRNRFELSHYRKEAAKAELGLMAYHDVIYKPLNGKLSGNMRLAVFGIPSYNARMYAYENDVLYGYSFPVYHNNGIRAYVNARYRIGRNIDLWMRYASFIYRDLDEVGSGLDVIAGNRRSDIKVQLRWQF